MTASHPIARPRLLGIAAPMVLCVSPLIAQEVRVPTPTDPSAAAALDQPEEQQDPALQPDGKRIRRVVNGHYFIPSPRGKDPFVTTYVRTATGLGIAFDLNVPFLDLDGNEVATLEGNLAFFTLEFEYQQSLTDWLALRGTMTGVARVGTNSEALLASGVSALNGFGFGMLGRLWQSEHFYLAGSLDLGRNTLFFVTPLEFVQSVVDEGELDEETAAELSGDADNVRASGSLRLAYAPADWIGFTALGETGFGNPFEEEEGTELLFNGRIGASLDLGELTSVPLGFQVMGTTDSFRSEGEDIAEAVRGLGVGIFWTGERDFSIGLQGRWLRIPLKDNDVTIDSMTMQFSLRYYF